MGANIRIIIDYTKQTTKKALIWGVVGTLVGETNYEQALRCKSKQNFQVEKTNKEIKSRFNYNKTFGEKLMTDTPP
jgi:hypothetical protein